MDVNMTIQTFSERIGLPASTLRYYEKEGLLKPHIRAENGYRLYRKDQIPDAMKIHTLRQADISLNDIRQYLASDADRQMEWLRKWRQDVDTKLSALHVARQFLYGVEKIDEQIQLIKWDTSTRMIWFRHRVQRQLNPYAHVIEERAAFMDRLGLLNSREAFVRQERIVGDEMIGKVGFRVSGKSELPDTVKQEAEIEILQPTLFVALDCLSNDPYACFSLMLLLQSFGFEPAGPNLERYQLNDKLHYQWMVPVIHSEATN